MSQRLRRFIYSAFGYLLSEGFSLINSFITICEANSWLACFLINCKVHRGIRIGSSDFPFVGRLIHDRVMTCVVRTS